MALLVVLGAVVGGKLPARMARVLRAGRGQLITDRTAVETAAAAWQHECAQSVLASVTPGSPTTQHTTVADTGAVEGAHA